MSCLSKPISGLYTGNVHTAFVVSKLKDTQKYPSAIRTYLERAFKPEIMNGADAEPVEITYCKENLEIVKKLYSYGKLVLSKMLL